MQHLPSLTLIGSLDERHNLSSLGTVQGQLDARMFHSVDKCCLYLQTKSNIAAQVLQLQNKMQLFINQTVSYIENLQK